MYKFKYEDNWKIKTKIRNKQQVDNFYYWNIKELFDNWCITKL